MLLFPDPPFRIPPSGDWRDLPAPPWAARLRSAPSSLAAKMVSVREGRGREGGSIFYEHFIIVDMSQIIKMIVFCCDLLEHIIIRIRVVCFLIGREAGRWRGAGSRSGAGTGSREREKGGGDKSGDESGDQIFRETRVPGNVQVCGRGEATAIWSIRRCKPAACILGLTGANMRLPLICGFP